MKSFAILYNRNGRVDRDIICAENMRLALKMFYEDITCGEYNVLYVSDITEICVDDVYIMNYNDVCKSLEEVKKNG